MRKLLNRRLVWLSAMAMVLLPALSLIVFLGTRSKINAANGYRIRPGMTLEEVEEILGGPPRVEGKETLAKLASNKFWDPKECTREGIVPENGNLQRAWRTDECYISVSFQGERVSLSGIIAKPGYLERIKEWLCGLLE